MHYERTNVPDLSSGTFALLVTGRLITYARNQKQQNDSLAFTGDTILKFKTVDPSEL